MIIGSSSRVIDVGRDDGAAARDLVAHELRRDVRGDGGAEAFAVGERRLGASERGLAAEVLAVRDVDHLLGDDAGAGKLVLRHRLAGDGRAAARLVGEVAGQMRAGNVAVVLRLDRRGRRIARRRRAPCTQASRMRGRPFSTSIAACGIRVGAGRVVDAERRLARAPPPARSRGTARAHRHDLQARCRPWCCREWARW